MDSEVEARYEVLCPSCYWDGSMEGMLYYHKQGAEVLTATFHTTCPICDLEIEKEM